jgi:hypothetical protein
MCASQKNSKFCAKYAQNMQKKKTREAHIFTHLITIIQQISENGLK